MSTPDGIGTGQTAPFSNNNASVSCTLTTSANGLVVVIVMNLGFNQNTLLTAPQTGNSGENIGPEGPQSVQPVSDNSGQNIAWTLLGTVNDPYGHGQLQVYYGLTSAPLTNTKITAAFETVVETAAIMAFGLDNVDPTVLLDPSTALPTGKAFETVSGSITYTTKNALDLALLIYGINGAADSVSSITSGWSLLGQFNTVNGLNYDCNIWVYYQLFTGIENTLPVTVTHDGGTADGWELIAAAFEYKAAPVTLSRVAAVGF